MLGAKFVSIFLVEILWPSVCNQANLSTSFRVTLAPNFLENWLKHCVILGNNLDSIMVNFTQDNLEI
jgi:hypothetical protein